MRERTRAWKLVVALALLASAIPAQAAFAHGVDLSITPREGVEVKAAFDGGEPMAGAQVSVFAPGEPDEPWLVGTADEDGRFFFVPDPELPGTWEAQVRQAGHGGTVEIEVEPAGAGQATEAADPAPPAETPPAQAAPGGPATPAQTTAGGLTTLQKALMIACVIWGAIGTALYFKRKAV